MQWTEDILSYTDKESHNCALPNASLLSLLIVCWMKIILCNKQKQFFLSIIIINWLLRCGFAETHISTHLADNICDHWSFLFLVSSSRGDIRRSTRNSNPAITSLTDDGKGGFDHRF